MSFRIESVVAAISVGRDGDEGVCAVQIGEMWMPLIAADEKRLPWINEQADLLRAAGIKVQLIRLTQREEVEL